MAILIGQIQGLYRYPVKSMAGEPLDAADLGWFGIEGDRRYAFRRLADQSGFPWLTASKLPELVLFKPIHSDPSKGNLPTHVCTPDGKMLGIASEELRAEISGRYGADVQLMRLDQGMFDMATISLLALETSKKITSDAGQPTDVRRFRPNIFMRAEQPIPFIENEWVGKTVQFGEGDDSPTINITLRDERCVMINLNPDTAKNDSAMLKTVVRLNETCAGVYATVTHRGLLHVGQNVYLK